MLCDLPLVPLSSLLEHDTGLGKLATHLIERLAGVSLSFVLGELTLQVINTRISIPSPAIEAVLL